MKLPQLAFFRDRTTFYSLLVCVVLISMSPPGAVRASNFPDAGGGASCSDPITSCRKPVKFISNINGCYTFACEYGAASQHIIHTSDESHIRTLLQMAKESRH
jgi:hypothetical protein